MVKPTPWIGLDLDSTLAHYVSGQGIDSIGDPIRSLPGQPPTIFELLRDQWLKNGHPDFNYCKDFRIFTARVAPVGRDHQQIWKQTDMIKEWCQKYLGQVLPVTCTKDMAMLHCFDDRCSQVLRNVGYIVEAPLL